MKMISQGFECYTSPLEYLTYSKRMEKAGRVCYKSEEKITNDSADKFIRGIIKSGHETILEHCSLTFKFTIDTKTATALTRHRHSSPSQESTHYIDYGKRYKELTFIRPVEANDEELEAIMHFYEMLEYAYYTHPILSKMKKTLKRIILPFGLKAEVVITANMREWRHILRLRADKHAHFQMRALMRELLYWFRQELPLFVEDIKGEDYGD
jgi:thymidylate synthase (FAD)